LAAVLDEETKKRTWVETEREGEEQKDTKKEKKKK
jgi:hypothetical protein